jgi:CHASE3 domain sensor protein
MKDYSKEELLELFEHYRGLATDLQERVQSIKANVANLLNIVRADKMNAEISKQAHEKTGAHNLIIEEAIGYGKAIAIVEKATLYLDHLSDVVPVEEQNMPKPKFEKK